MTQEQGAPPRTQEVRQAATVVLLRDLPAGPGAPGVEVFLQRRSRHLAFAPGMYVFPGGAADPSDLDLRATAVREVAEETGVVMPVTGLLEWARWITPPGLGRRFDTWFYVARLPEGADPVTTGDEMDRSEWRGAREAALAWQGKEFSCLPPTIVTIAEMATYTSVDAVLAAASQRDLTPIARSGPPDPATIRAQVESLLAQEPS
jgi:8-oxo-dGTP pyrophosphatase MutT (NUDIX family)